jgi:hypothetical protein
MLTGAVEVYANHAVIIVGSTAPPDIAWGDGPAAAGRTTLVERRVWMSVWSLELIPPW